MGLWDGLQSSPRWRSMFRVSLGWVRTRGGLPRPCQPLVVEPLRKSRFDDCEIGREIEISRCIKAVMANMQDLLPAKLADPRRLAGDALHARQDGILHAPECLCDQRRADCARRLSGTQSNQAT